jgi:hypothetical protein
MQVLIISCECTSQGTICLDGPFEQAGVEDAAGYGTQTPATPRVVSDV